MCDVCEFKIAFGEPEIVLSRDLGNQIPAAKPPTFDDGQLVEAQFDSLRRLLVAENKNRGLVNVPII